MAKGLDGPKRFKLLIHKAIGVEVHFVDLLPSLNGAVLVEVDGKVAYGGRSLPLREVMEKLKKVEEKGHEVLEVPFKQATESDGQLGKRPRRKGRRAGKKR